LAIFLTHHAFFIRRVKLHGTLFALDPTDDDKIMAEGIGRFCEDLKLDPTNLRVLLIAWKFKAATQCEFTRKEFTDGMLELG